MQLTAIQLLCWGGLPAVVWQQCCRIALLCTSVLVLVNWKAYCSLPRSCLRLCCILGSFGMPSESSGGADSLVGTFGHWRMDCQLLTSTSRVMTMVMCHHRVARMNNCCGSFCTVSLCTGAHATHLLVHMVEAVHMFGLCNIPHDSVIAYASFVQASHECACCSCSRFMTRSSARCILTKYRCACSTLAAQNVYKYL